MWLPQLGPVTLQPKSRDFGIWFSHSPSFLYSPFGSLPKASALPLVLPLRRTHDPPHHSWEYQPTLRLVPNAQRTEAGLERTELTQQGDKSIQQLGMETD